MPDRFWWSIPRKSHFPLLNTPIPFNSTFSKFSWKHRNNIYSFPQNGRSVSWKCSKENSAHLWTHPSCSRWGCLSTPSSFRPRAARRIRARCGSISASSPRCLLGGGDGSPFLENAEKKVLWYVVYNNANAMVRCKFRLRVLRTIDFQNGLAKMTLLCVG